MPYPQYYKVSKMPNNQFRLETINLPDLHVSYLLCTSSDHTHICSDILKCLINFTSSHFLGSFLPNKLRTLDKIMTAIYFQAIMTQCESCSVSGT